MTDVEQLGLGRELLPPRAPRPRTLTLRALFVGLIGVAAVCFIVAWAELVTGQIMIGFLQLPPVVIAALFVLVLLVKGMRRISPRLALQPGEMVVVYVMMLIASMISSRGLMEDLIPTLVGVNYYADPGNRWQDLFYAHVRPWMVPWDPGGGIRQFISTAFYEGLREGERLPWAAWLRPIGYWLILVGAIYCAFLCLATILRRQWSDNERLSYPLVQLPLEMIREQRGRSFYSNPLTWIGFAIPTVLFGVNGLHGFNPALPQLRVEFSINRYFPARPWSDITFFVAYLSPGAIGFFYLLPVELLLSFWLFFLLAKVQDLFFSAMAFPPISTPHGSGDGYMDYQTMGAYFMLVAYLGAVAWPHLKGALRRAVSRQGPDDRGEMMSYRLAVWGLIASLTVAAVWLHQAGVAIGFAVFSILVYVFVEVIIMARGTVEGGLPMTEGAFTPMDISALAVAPAALGPSTLTGIAFFDAMFTRDLRGLVFTGFLDGQKLGDETGVARRRLLSVFIIALLISIPIAAIIHLWLPYHRGGLSLYSFTHYGNNIQFFRENAAWLQGEKRNAAGAAACFIAGALITMWLAIMRVRYVGWPFHPLGYALSTSWTTMVFWFPMLVAWILKSAIVHYGGMRLYARARPLFLGMIFGEFCAAVFWTLIAAVFNIQAPFFPWP
jgi:hypothetical protein